MADINVAITTFIILSLVFFNRVEPLCLMRETNCTEVGEKIFSNDTSYVLTTSNQTYNEQEVLDETESMFIRISVDNLVYGRSSNYGQVLQNGSAFDVPPAYRNISLSLYYYCNEISSDQGTIDRYVHMSCPCEDSASKKCCSSGHVVFIPQGYRTDTWECSVIEEDIRNFEYSAIVLYQLPPYVFIPDDFGCSDYENKDQKTKSNWEYVILIGNRPYTNTTNGDLQTELVSFNVMYQCRSVGYKDVNSTVYQQVVCVNVRHQDISNVTPWFVDYYQGMVIMCVIFTSMTVLVFAVLPDVRTMKSKIIISQTFSFLILNVLNLIYYGAEGHLPKVECIVVAYMTHFWNLVGTFWVNVLCIDMFWTFSGTHFHKSERWKFMAYSVYAWGASLVITAVTALLDFLDNVPENIIRPNISPRTCWFSDFKSLLAYDYGPVLFITVLNGPLVGYSVYRITRTLCSTSILHNNGSHCHAGSKAKKNKKRFVIYVNLAMMFGTPRLLSFVRLLVDDEVITLAVNLISMLRSVFIFLFVCCRPKVGRIILKHVSVWRSKIRTLVRISSRQNTQELSTKQKTSFSIENETRSSAV